MKITQPVNYEHSTPNQCSRKKEQKIVMVMDEKLYDVIFFLSKLDDDGLEGNKYLLSQYPEYINSNFSIALARGVKGNFL